MEKIYLDNTATTKVDKDVADFIYKILREDYGNPSSSHSLGQQAKFILDDAREKVSRLINANINNIYFTSGGTEADSWALRGVIEFALLKEKTIHIITSSYEHSAILQTCQYLEADPRVEISYLDPDEKGYINPHKVQEAIRANTVLVSIMHINNEIGIINDIQQIGKICRESGVLFHTDAVQSLGKIEIDVHKMNIDLLSMSAHKIYGPKGVGALYIRNKVGVMPLIHGGGQENKMRMGTENLPGIGGFGLACEKLLQDNKSHFIASLRRKFYDLILNSGIDFKLNGSLKDGYYGILSMTFFGIEGEALLLNLDMDGVMVSTGSACSSGSKELSKTLKSIGLTPEEIHSTLRISFGKYNTESEIIIACEKIVKTVKRLKEMSF